MKNFNISTATISYHIEESNPNLINQEIVKTFFASPPMKEILKPGICILDIFSSGRNIYDGLPRDFSCEFISLDPHVDMRLKDDQRVISIESYDINKIKLDDAVCDVIFAPASKVGYGKFHASIFEIERLIKPQGYLICDLSRFWFTRQFNQLLFCSRGWDLTQAIEINYMFKGTGEEHSTARYYLLYRKQP